MRCEKQLRIVLTAALAAPVAALGTAFVLCGYLGGFWLLLVWTVGSAIWKLWRHPLTRRYLAGYCAVVLMLAGFSWAAVPRLTFHQAQRQVLALPENAAAEAVDQGWRRQLLPAAPPAAKDGFMEKGYFVVVEEGTELRGYFVHPRTGRVVAGHSNRPSESEKRPS